MVLRRKEASYQLPRTSSRFFGSENIHQIKSMRTCETADGQYISSCLHKQNGRYTFEKFSEFSNRSVGMVLSKSFDSVSPAHLPGRLNVRADRESRVLEDSSDWKLSPDIFQTLQNKWGPFEVDLFASRLTKQLPKFASWKPDPMAAYTDAFSLDWGQILGYAFPPFALIGRCVRQLRSQKVDQLVLVAPVWPTQPCYPLLLQMSVEPPLLFPMFPQLLTKGS